MNIQRTSMTSCNNSKTTLKASTETNHSLTKTRPWLLNCTVSMNVEVDWIWRNMILSSLGSCCIHNRQIQKLVKKTKQRSWSWIVSIIQIQLIILFKVLTKVEPISVAKLRQNLSTTNLLSSKITSFNWRKRSINCMKMLRK